VEERVGVVVNQGKRLDGDPDGLRRALTERGLHEPRWLEVPKSKYVPGAVSVLVDDGIDRILVWGGDGTVRRCIDQLCRLNAHDVVLGVLPAGTGNVLALNLDIPVDLEASLDIALGGQVDPIDVGRVDGDYFAVVAGAGFDGELIRRSQAGLKERLDRVGYLWAALRSSGIEPVNATVRVDGRLCHDGPATCVIAANVPTILGGLRAFPAARLDDGALHLAIVTADSPAAWAGVLGQAILDEPDASSAVTIVQGRRIEADFAAPLAWQIDGGDRPATRRMRWEAVPAAVRMAHGPAAAMG
jgi:diacylglycerol kinase family enzyme